MRYFFMFPSKTPDIRECEIYDRFEKMRGAQFLSETTEVTQGSPGGH